MKGREYDGYVYVDADAVNTAAALKYSVDLALAYNETMTSSK